MNSFHYNAYISLNIETGLDDARQFLEPDSEAWYQMELKKAIKILSRHQILKRQSIERHKHNPKNYIKT